MPYAVKFETVSKRYRVDAHVDTLRGALSQVFHRNNKPRSQTLALDRISFEVEEGQAFGIIGPNGAGKSTTLKILCGIAHPTSGRVHIRGRVAALIEVAGGIHPDLTGRENIWLYGRVLGLSRSEIRRRLDDIVGFSGLGHVLDKPVKMYSTGMQLRLGFSVASHLYPNIFVVDEALAVGDAVFQAKCVERMLRLVSEGTTLLFVSHQLSAVESLCQQGLFLREGRIAAIGETKSVLKKYADWVDGERLREWQTREANSNPTDVVQVVSATCHHASGKQDDKFTSDEPIEIRLTFRAARPIRKPHITVGITDGRPQMLMLCSTLHRGEPPDLVQGEWSASCRIERLNLMPRAYRVWSGVNSEHGHVALLSDWQEVSAFRVVTSEGDEELNGKSAVMFESLYGAVKSDYQWSYRGSVTT